MPRSKARKVFLIFFFSSYFTILRKQTHLCFKESYFFNQENNDSEMRNGISLIKMLGFAISSLVGYYRPLD